MLFVVTCGSNKWPFPSGYHILAVLEFYHPTPHFLWKPAFLSMPRFLQFNSSQTSSAFWAQRLLLQPQSGLKSTLSLSLSLPQQRCNFDWLWGWDRARLNGSKSINAFQTLHSTLVLQLRLVYSVVPKGWSGQAGRGATSGKRTSFCSHCQSHEHGWVVFCSVFTPSSPAWGWPWLAAFLVTVHICQHPAELYFPLRYWLSFFSGFHRVLPPNNTCKSHASSLHRKKQLLLLCTAERRSGEMVQWLQNAFTP